MTRPDSPAWITCKAEGDRAELAIAEWFRGRGFDTFKTLGDAPFDLLLQAAVEVKRDLKAAQTGNVAIETKYNGQPSGIRSSTASYWAIVLDAEAVVIKTEKLLEMVLAGKYRETRAGDRLAATVRLVPVERLKAAKVGQVIPLSEVPQMMT